MNVSIAQITVYEIPKGAVRHILAFGGQQKRPIFAPPGSLPPGRYREDPQASLPDGVMRLLSLADLTYAVMVDFADVEEFAIDYIPGESECLPGPPPDRHPDPIAATGF